MIDYTMNGEISILETVKSHPYLGVSLIDNLKYNTHIDNIDGQSFADTWIHQMQLEIMPTSVKDRAYQTHVRPRLEYSSSILNPQQQAQIKQIEQVQCNAARLVISLVGLRQV